MKEFNKHLLKLAMLYMLLTLWFLLSNGCSASMVQRDVTVDHPLMQRLHCTVPPNTHDGHQLVDCLVTDDDHVSCFYVKQDLDGRKCVGLVISADCMNYQAVWGGCEGDMVSPEREE